MFSIFVIYLTIFNLTFARQFQSENSHEVETISASKVHSRHKRGWGGLLRGTLTGVSWGSYGAAIGITLYADITRCRDFKPSPCQTVTCRFVNPCPDTCTIPKNNADELAKQRDVIYPTLDKMDELVSQALSLEVDGKSAGINNKMIVDSINKINDELDKMAVDMVLLDTQLSERYLNMSREIEKLIIERRISLIGLMSTPEFDGIFDKFTVMGTGRFIFSIAFTVGVTAYSHLAKRFAINTIYTDMKNDFSKQFVNQKGVNSKIQNKFAYIQGYTTKGIDNQLQKSARSVYNAQQATKTQKIVNNVVTPAINAIYTVFSFWSIYNKIEQCEEFANEMQDSVVTMVEEREKCEEIMETKVKPLRQQVIDENFGPVISFLNNETIVNTLESIRNFTIEIFNKSKETDDIDYFLDNIASADHTNILFIQQKLVKSLPTIFSKLSCLANRQHAITYTVRDCKLGRDALKVLFDEAVAQLKLNDEDCIDAGTVARLSQSDIENMINAIAKDEDWYSDCLLNNIHLLSSVCGEHYKGLSTDEIISKMNKTSLSNDHVKNYLTRCPLREVSKSDESTICTLYCNGDTTHNIASALHFTEEQAGKVIKNCTCYIPDSLKTEICALAFCKGENISSISGKFNRPGTIINNTITQRCNGKCELSQSQQMKGCELFMCESLSIVSISSILDVPTSTVQENITEARCTSTTCVVSAHMTYVILLMHCKYGFTAQEIYQGGVVGRLPLQFIESTIISKGCT